MARKSKAENFDEEIHQCDEKIAKIRARKQQLIQLKSDRENEEIISLVRDNNMSYEELKELISAFAGDSKKNEKSSVNGKGEMKNEIE